MARPPRFICIASRCRQEVECPRYLAWAAQPQYDEMCAFALRQPFRGFAAAALPGAPGPADRVAGPYQVPPALAVAGPQLGVKNEPEKRTGDYPSHDHRA